MNQRVALVAAGASGQGALSSRIDAFTRGLQRRGWTVELADVDAEPTPVDRLVDHLPSRLRHRLEAAGAEGDLRPGIAYRSRRHLRRLRADVAVVSVPPFSLLPAAARWLPPGTPLIVDYRDPWSARASPPPLARMTGPVERRLLRQVAAVTYAGSSDLASRLIRGTAPLNRIVAVPNGFDPTDLHGVPPAKVHIERNGTPLDLVFVGYWYGRNGPGRLPDVLAHVGPSVARLTIIGQASPPIAAAFNAITGSCPTQVGPMQRSDTYHRLAQADVAVVTLDDRTAIESRVPAKVYDYLAVGVPVVALCPPHATLLRLPEAQHFHHFDPDKPDDLTAFLYAAAADRTMLRPGPQGVGPIRDRATDMLDQILRTVMT